MDGSVLAFLNYTDGSVWSDLNCKDGSVWSDLNCTDGSVWSDLNLNSVSGLNLLPPKLYSWSFLTYPVYYARKALEKRIWDRMHDPLNCFLHQFIHVSSFGTSSLTNFSLFSLSSSSFSWPFIAPSLACSFTSSNSITCWLMSTSLVSSNTVEELLFWSLSSFVDSWHVQLLWRAAFPLPVLLLAGQVCPCDCLGGKETCGSITLFSYIFLWFSMASSGIVSSLESWTSDFLMNF